VTRVGTAFAIGLAAALAGFGTPPAGAADHGGGQTCGLAAADPTGTGEVTGVLTGGPWQAPDGAMAVVRCTVAVARPMQPPQVVARADSGPGTVAYVAPAAVAFRYVPGAAATLTVCTEIDVYRDGNPPEVYQYDADHDPSNGAQCADARPEGDEGGRVYVAPPQSDGDICVYVKHNLQPPPADTAGGCIPWGSVG